jgi:rhodanese-related sulfurtransferase
VPRRASLLILLCQTAVVVVLGALAGLGANAVRARRLPLVAAPFDHLIRCEEPTLKAAARTVDVDEVRRLLGAAGVVLVDVREAEAYAAGHIAGARSIPASLVAPADPARIKALGSPRLAVLYDDGDDLLRAEELAGELKSLAKEIRFLAPGLKGWTAAGQPLTKGAQP